VVLSCSSKESKETIDLEKLAIIALDDQLADEGLTGRLIFVGMPNKIDFSEIFYTHFAKSKATVDKISKTPLDFKKKTEYIIVYEFKEIKRDNNLYVINCWHTTKYSFESYNYTFSYNSDNKSWQLKKKELVAAN
jgi:hypothetical protein